MSLLEIKYLLNLICVPNGIVLDPFCGSGSTLVAAIYEHYHYIGIEQDESYCAIARARVAYAEKQVSA